MTDFNRVEFPLFEVASCPKISLSQIKSRRFDLFRRYLEKCPACGVQMSGEYPYHPEDDCIYGLIYNVDES